MSETRHRVKDALAVVIDEEVLERVTISKWYEIVLRRALIGKLDAVALTLRFVEPDGGIREKVSIRVFINRLDELADALRRVSKRLASEEE